MKNMIISVIMITVGIVMSESCPAIERSATVIGSRVQMHESAAGDSAAVGLLSEGTSAAVLGRQPKPVDVGNFTDYWYLVGYRGKAGWVFGQFLLVSSNGRGLARIFTADELIDYCDDATKNLVRIKDARLYDALAESSERFIADIGEMNEDPILSAHAGTLEPYRLLAAWSLAVGYVGIGDSEDAEKIREQLLSYDPTTILPDRTTLGIKLHELDEMMQPTEKTIQ
jgi:hypothetical protein